MSEKLEQFNKFLKNIDLKKYREKYSKIKTVELDLPKEIQCIEKCYEFYWDKFELINFEDFYENHKNSIESQLEDFRKKSFFSEDTFYLGFPARMYRTWASLLTQIQGGFAANSIYKKVLMSADLDYSGIDMQIYYNDDAYVNLQIKKESLSREVRVPKKIKKRKQEIINITYEVPGDISLTQKGEERKPVRDWKSKWGKKLNILDNGFVIFLPEMFEKNNIKANDGVELTID